MERLFQKKLQLNGRKALRLPGGAEIDADGGPTLFQKIFK
jgi:hypothetical protein